MCWSPMPWSNDSANPNRAVNHSPGDQKIPHVCWSGRTLNFIPLLSKEITPKYSVVCPATGHAISSQIPGLLPFPAASQQIIPWCSPQMFLGHLYKGLGCTTQGSNKSHATHILAYHHKDIRLVKNAREKDLFAAHQGINIPRKKPLALETFAKSLFSKNEKRNTAQGPKCCKKKKRNLQSPTPSRFITLASAKNRHRSAHGNKGTLQPAHTHEYS